MDKCKNGSRAKEIELWKRKFLKLQCQFVNQKQEKQDALVLKQELSDYRTKYDESCAEIQEKSIVIEEIKTRLSTAEIELTKYKTMCDELNKCVEEYKRRFKEFAVQADMRLKYEIELETKLEDCETRYTAENGRLVNELNEYKGMRGQLDKQIKNLEEIDEKLVTNDDDGEQYNKLFKVIEYLVRDKRRAEDEMEVLQTEFMELKSRTALWQKELDVYKDKERHCVGYESKLKNPTSIRDAVGSEHEDQKTSNGGLKQETMGLTEVRKVMSKGEKRAEKEKTASLERVRKKIEGDKREVLGQDLKLENNKTCEGCDKKISPKQLNGTEEKPSILTGNATKRLYAGEEGKECGISSAPKRWRVSDKFTNNSMKRIEKLSIDPKLKMAALSPGVGDQNVEKSVPATSQQGTCELGKKSQAGDTSKDENTSPGNLDVVDGSTGEKLGNQILGRFMAKGSEGYGSGDRSSDAEDARNTELDIGQNIAMRSSRYKKWQNEADMLSSFEEDPTLCMKAVCALRRQDSEIIGSLHRNNRSLRCFRKFVALSGRELAEFLMGEDPKGDLKKSKQELEMFKAGGLEDCERLARYYSKHLFTIYENNKDPFFSPSYFCVSRQLRQ